MTPREEQTLKVVRGWIERTGNAPTIEEIAAGLGLAGRGSAHRAIDGLVRAGHLVRERCRTRGLRLPDAPCLAAVSTAALSAELARRAGEGRRS